MRCLTAILIIIAAMGAAPASEPATQPGFAQLFDSMRRQKIKEVTQVHAAMPDAGEKRMDELVRLSLVEGCIQVASLSAPTQEPARVKLTGVNGMASIDVRGESERAEDVSILQVQIYDHDRPGELQRHSNLFASPFNVQLTQVIETPMLDTMIQFVQSRDEEEASTMLSVQSDSRLSGDVTESLVFRAETFSQLLERYPREVHRYLTPIARDLQLERAIFAPEPQIARKALGIATEVDRKLAAQVEAILPRLEALDFRTRETAMRELRAIGKPAAGALAQMNRKDWSAARVAAVDSFLAEMDVPTQEESNQLSTSPDFLIRCLYLTDPAIRSAAIKTLEARSGKPLNVDLNQEITKTIDQLYQKLIPPARLDEPE